MSSSDDDVPLVKNRTQTVKSGHKSTEHNIKQENEPNGNALSPGISMRNGPVQSSSIGSPINGLTQKNGTPNGKRKSRDGIRGNKSYKDNSSDDDDKPLLKRRKTSPPKGGNKPLSTIEHKKSQVKPPSASKTKLADSSDSDVPLGQKLAKVKKNIEKLAVKEAKTIRRDENRAKKQVSRRSADDDDDDDVPLSKKKRKSLGDTSNVNGVEKGVKKEATGEAKANNRRASSSKAVKVKSENSTPIKRIKSAVEKKGAIVKKEAPAEDKESEEEEEEEEYRWWEDPTKGDGTIKWTNLEHNGVVFPPPYETLPSHVKMRYNGIPVNLAPEAEEVATFYGSMLNSTVNVENPTFNKNFFADFKEVLQKTGHAKDKDGNIIKIKEFEKCDFRPIFEYYDGMRAAKKALPTAEKKAIKAAKDEAEASYMYCLWDGRKQKVGNFRVEPPGLFRGRGEHPKTGKVKKRVQPEQITINIGKSAPVPVPPEGHRWKDIKHDQEGTWLAMWQENINGAYKYVMLAANSDVKGQSDYKKFEKARELKKYIDHIRRDYTKDLKAELMADRQRATAVYLIDKLALRAGNEKGDDEAETVGCCSLKFENITLKPPNIVVFDFLGKDSIRYYDEVAVDTQVFKNLKIFKKAPKKEGDEIFDRLTTSSLNKHLGSYMPGLTAKVFRTYNASWTMANLLKNMVPKGNIPEKLKDYNYANREVAILCNHKRTVTASHATQMEKMQDKINGLRYQQWRVKQMMLDLEPKLKKKKGAEYFALPEDLSMDWVKEHQNAQVEEMRQKIQKKFEKENEKLAAEGQKEMKARELEERLKATDELRDKFKKENKTGKVEAEGKGPTIEKFEANLDKLQQRIENMKVQVEDKDNNKEVALGTSKINYIDPRLTVVFSRKFDVPIEKLFSKTLREKFDWAIKSVDENWEF